MVPLLSELWRLAAYLLSPEDTRDGGADRSQGVAAWRGAAKTLLWAGLGVLAGLGLGGLR